MNVDFDYLLVTPSIAEAMVPRIMLFFGVYWSTLPSQIGARSKCPSGTESIVTNPVGSRPYIVISKDELKFVTDPYTDRQLGIFRLARLLPHSDMIYFLVPATPQIFVLVISCQKNLPTHIMAIVVINPWTRASHFMQTIHTEDIQHGAVFRGFNKDWTAVAVTNSAEERVNLLLCDPRESIIFDRVRPAGSTFPELQPDDRTLAEQRCEAWANVTSKWQTPYASGLRYVKQDMARKIEKFAERHWRLRNMMASVVWLMLAVAVWVALYMVVKSIAWIEL